MTTPLGITLNLDGAKQVQAGLAGVSKSVESVGVSAAQTAAAMRMIPAQFTDIVVGLSSGQAPLTVLLQQGGQLKDMFGGAGAAAKALGTYVVGLINPFTLAAAAVGVLAVAYNQGSKEADAYRLALVGTGNAVGSTVGQLKTYAQEIAGVIGTQGKAAESLAAFVSTGKVSRDVLKESAQAAIAWERASGQAVEKTAKQFADLAKDPLDAVLKLNEGTNFLTVSVYRQIKGLEEQGKTAEAAAAAQRAYAQALTGRSNEITQNLGYIETAWNGITSAAKKSWDAMLNVGRASTPADASAELRARLTRQQQELADKKAINPYADTSGMEKGIEVLKQRLGLLESDERQQRRLAAAEAERVEQVQRLAQWDKESDQFKQKAAKRDEEINKAEVEGRALIAAGLIKEADLRERIAGIKKKYQETGSAGTGENEVAAILARNELAAEHLKKLRAQIQGEGALSDAVKPTKSEEDVARLKNQLLEKSLQGVARAQKEKALAAAEAGVQTDKDIVAAEKQKKALTELQGLMGKQVDAVQKQADAIRDQAVGQEAVNANFGKSKTAIEQATLAQLKLQLAEADSSDRFAPAYVAALESKTNAQERYVQALQQSEYLQTNQKLDESARAAKEETTTLQLQISLLGASRMEREKITELRKVDLKLAKELADIDKLNLGTGDEAERQRQALKDKAEANAVLERSNAATKVVLNEWERTTEQINQSLTDALMRGFESGKGFAQNLRDTIKNMFGTLVLRPIISAVINPVAGMVGSVVNGAVGSIGGSMLSSAGGSFLGNTAMGASGIGSGFMSGMSETFLGSSFVGPSATAAGGATGFGATLGTIAPYALAAAAIFGIIKSLDDSGTYHTGGAAQYNATTGLTSGQSGADYNIGFGRVERGDQTITAVGTIAKGIGSALDGVAKAFGQKAGYEVATAFADDTSKDGAWGALRISKDGKELLNWENTRMSKWAPKEFADGEEGYKQYLAAVAKDTRQVLLDMDLPSWADTMLNAIGDSASMEDLTAVIQQIGVVQTAFVNLGKSIEGFAGMTDKAFEAIMKASGGIDALSANANTYYQNFYSSDERKAKAREQVQAQLADLGIKDINFDAPDAREQYRKLVDEALERANTQAKSRDSLVASFAGLDLGSVTTGSLGDMLSGFGGGKATPEALAGLAASLNALGQSASGLDDIQKSITDYVTANAQALGLEDDAASTVAALLGLSGAFAEVTQSAEDTQAAMEQQAREAQSQALRNLQEAYNRERKRLEAQLDSIADTRAAYEQQQSIVQETYDTLSGVFDLLHESVLDLYGSVESTVQMQAEEAARFIAQSVSNAQLTGYLPEQDKLSEAITAARAGIDAGTYANSTEQDFAKLVLAGQLKALEAVAEPQKTAAEQQLDLLKGQIDALDKQTEAINKQIKLQQESLDYWQEQIDIANGVYDATLSVEEAIKVLTDLMFPKNTKTPYQVTGTTGGGSGGAVFGGGGGNGGTAATSPYSRPVSLGTAGVSYSPVTDQAEVDKLNSLAGIYHKYDGTGDLTGLLTDIKNAGGTIRDLEALSGYYQSDWERAAAAVGIPAFAVGTNYVPKDMLAQIHEGEAIVPKAFNPWAGGSMGNDNTALIAEIRALREEVSVLRAAAQETAAATGDTADVLVRVTNNGNGMIPGTNPLATA